MVNETDNYFGFGIIEQNSLTKGNDNYLCYEYRPGKTIDVRYGNVNGYDEGGYANINTDWGRCCSPSNQICIAIDYTKKLFLFELNGKKSFTRKIENLDTNYVFVFDPYYTGTKFSVEFL